MSSVTILQARTDERGIDHAVLAEALDALGEVALAATSCADGCLTAEEVHATCVQACLDAADVAAATARVLSRTGPTVQGTRRLVDATAQLLAECAQECEEMAVVHRHARACADACQRAQRALAGVQTAVARADQAD